MVCLNKVLLRKTFGRKMWIKIAVATVVVLACTVGVVYVTYFHRPPTQDILANNKVGRMSRKALGHPDSGQDIDLQIAQYQVDKWDAWMEQMHFVSIGELYDKCEGEDRIMLGRVVLLPDRKFGGVTSKVYSNFTLHEEINEGEMHIVVQYNGVELYKNHWPICTVEDGMDDRIIVCPIPPGKKRFIKNLKIPNYLPKGRYTTKAWAFNQDEKMFACAFSEFVL